MAVLQVIRNFLIPPSESVTEVIEPAPWTTYEVRRLAEIHLDEVLRLNLRCFKNGENYTKHTFSYLLTQPNALCYQILTAEGRMAGFVCVLANEDGTAHITTIGVAPEHRRRGLAEKLLEHLDGSLRSKGIYSVLLEVRVGNIAAQNLYKRCGYSITQRIAHYYNNGEDGFLMMKALN
jgi:ribosomal-protein-alanine acetyltransferase